MAMLGCPAGLIASARRRLCLLDYPPEGDLLRRGQPGEEKHGVSAVRILELGSYAAPAYAGMILAQQGHQVTKWTLDDPILHLEHGKELWEWFNHGKQLENSHAQEIENVQPGDFDAVIDNFREETWKRWNIRPSVQAERLNLRWIGLRADLGGRSFDVIAQARAWGDLGMLPFWIGDTAYGLWAAYILMNTQPGQYRALCQATSLAALVEGGLSRHQWEPEHEYGHDETCAWVRFKGETIIEPRRDAEWRAANLPNDGTYFQPEG